jgi:hypothetical protein
MIISTGFYLTALEARIVVITDHRPHDVVAHRAPRQILLVVFRVGFGLAVGDGGIETSLDVCVEAVFVNKIVNKHPLAHLALLRGQLFAIPDEY